MLRIGILGASGIAPAAVIRPAQRRDDVEIMAVAFSIRAEFSASIPYDSDSIRHDPHEDNIAGLSRVRTVGGTETCDYQLDAIVRGLQSGEPLLTEGTDSVRNMAVIDAIYEASGVRTTTSPATASSYIDKDVQ